MPPQLDGDIQSDKTEMGPTGPIDPGGPLIDPLLGHVSLDEHTVKPILMVFVTIFYSANVFRHDCKISF